MTDPLKTKLSKITDIKDFKNFIMDLSPIIKNWGGRRLVHSRKNFSRGSVSFNDVVKQLDYIFKSTPKNKIDTPFILHTIDITQNVQTKDEVCNSKLKSTNILTRILTIISQFFGNLTYNKRNTLKKILFVLQQKLSLEELDAHPQDEIPLDLDRELRKKQAQLAPLPLRDLMDKVKSSNLDEKEPDVNRAKIEQNALLREIIKKIEKFLTKKQFQELNEIALHVKSDPDLFNYFIDAVVAANSSSVLLTSKHIEEFEWPSPQLKEQKMPLIMARLVKNEFIWDSTKNKNWTECILNTEDLLNGLDFNQCSEILREQFSKALKIAFSQLGQDHLERKNHLKITFKQSDSHPWPDVLLPSLLDAFAQIPTLRSLDLSSLGPKLSDSDEQLILSVVETNPLLQELKIDLSSMNQNIREGLLNKMDERLNRKI